MIYQVHARDGSTCRRTAGFPFLQGLEPTLRALNALWFYAQRAGRAPAAPPPAPASDLTPANLDATLAQLRHRAAAKPRGRRRAAEAADAAAAIGFPVALKIRSADILHKTEAGGVMLDLRSRDEVLSAADALIEGRARGASRTRRIDGFLVQEMVSGVEAIVGAQQRSALWPAAARSAPAASWSSSRATWRCGCCRSTRATSTAMIDGLKLNQLLAGFRGRPPADRKALEATALGARAILSRSSRAHRRDRDQSADGARSRRGRRRRARALATSDEEKHDGFRASRRTAHVQGIAAALRRQRADPDRAPDDAARAARSSSRNITRRFSQRAKDLGIWMMDVPEEYRRRRPVGAGARHRRARSCRAPSRCRRAAGGITGPSRARHPVSRSRAR